MIWLYLSSQPPRAFYMAGDPEPTVAAPVLPLLVGVGTLHRPLNGENANITLEFDSARSLIRDLWADPPLLAAAVVYRDLEPLLSGTISAIELGAIVRLTIEA